MSKLQRVVPRWMKDRQFKFTFACCNASCTGDSLHFLDNIDIPALELNNEGRCSRKKISILKKSQMVWGKSQPTLSKSKWLFVLF